MQHADNIVLSRLANALQHLLTAEQLEDLSDLLDGALFDANPVDDGALVERLADLIDGAD